MEEKAGSNAEASGKEINISVHRVGDRYMSFAKILKTLIILAFWIVVAGAETTKEVHRDCDACHKEHNFKVINKNIQETCFKCHPTSKERDHPIGVTPAIVPEGLPLDEAGKITCITCHEPHGKNTVDKLLWKDFNSLCLSCHRE